MPVSIPFRIIDLRFILIKSPEKDVSDIVTCIRRSIGSYMTYELT